jgi:hypothetical protein
MNEPQDIDEVDRKDIENVSALNLKPTSGRRQRGSFEVVPKRERDQVNI